MIKKNFTPSKIINAAFVEYVKSHSDNTALEVLQDRKLDNLRLMASGFAMKEYLGATINEKNISYEIDNGSLVFKKHDLRICSLGPEVTNSMSITHVDNKVKIYRGNKAIMTLNDVREDTETLLLRIHCITLLFCYNSIVKGIDSMGLASDNNTKQISFIA